MRSATSFFDKTLFRSQLKHTWPLWLGYTALWLFLVPVALFSALSAYQGGYSAADASYLLLNTGVRGGVFISFVFGLFFAMLAFSHLTQSRATNGFHALPVRRETIFLTASRDCSARFPAFSSRSYSARRSPPRCTSASGASLPRPWAAPCSKPSFSTPSPRCA